MGITAVTQKKRINVTEVAGIIYARLSEDMQELRFSDSLWHLVYCDTGSAQLLLSDTPQVIFGGQTILCPPSKLRALAREDSLGGGVIIVAFSSSPSPELYSVCERVITCDRRTSGGFLDFYYEAKELFAFTQSAEDVFFSSAPQKRTPTGSEQIITNLCELSLLRLLLQRAAPETKTSSRSERGEQLAHRICDYMQEHMSEKITFSDISSSFLISPTTLKKLFRQTFGHGTMDHLCELRIERAKELLRDGRYSCTEISSLCGFFSIHHFSRVFKDRCGISPTEFAKEKGEK